MLDLWCSWDIQCRVNGFQPKVLGHLVLDLGGRTYVYSVGQMVLNLRCWTNDVGETL